MEGESEHTVVQRRERMFLLTVMLAAVATTLMLQSTRVFVSYLIFVVDQSNRATLGGTAALVFGAVGLGGVIVRLVGLSRALLLVAGVLLAARLTLQFWQQPEARIVLGALGIVTWGWLFVALVSVAREATAFGVVIGLGLDIAIRIAFRTVDLPWMPGVAAHIVTVLLVAGAGAAALWLARTGTPVPQDPVSAVSLVAVGPGFAIFHLMTGNIGMVRSMLNMGFSSAAVLLSFGIVLGVAIAALADTWPVARERQLGRVLGGMILLALVVSAIWFLWQRPEPSAFGVLAGVAGSAVLLSMAILGGEPGRVLRPGGAAAWLMAGMLVQVVLLFAYYTFTGPPLVIVLAWGIFVVGALATGTSTRGRSWRPVVGLAPVGALALVLIVALGVQFLSEDAPRPTGLAGSELTVMTYNIQSGFSRDNWWSLEETARTIEAESPDIVVLQEVGRGWLVTTTVDHVDWLSRRLGMPYVFGANSDDGQWGNAVLSRAPMSNVARHQYETTDNLKRGVISVLVETEAGGVWIFGTHLDNPSGAGEVRLRQVNELIDVIGGRTPALLLGDFNAEPDSDVLAALAQAGLIDRGDLLGPNATTSQDDRRIDYILASPDLTVTEMRIPQKWTSDHLPVVARVQVAP